MKKTTNTNSVWEQSQPTIEFTAKHPASDVDEWRKLTSRMVDAATEFGWTKAEVSRRTDVPDGTLSPWFAGKYLGVLSNINQKVANWLDALDASQNMAATADIRPKTRSGNAYGYSVLAGVRIFGGTMCGVTAALAAVPAGHASCVALIGFAEEAVDNRDGATGERIVTFETLRGF